MGEKWISAWNLINTGGVIALMFINLVLLIRGDILPRRVYEDLTKRILNELCNEVIEAIRTLIREEIVDRKGERD
jgi:hypothetical protein